MHFYQVSFRTATCMITNPFELTKTSSYKCASSRRGAYRMRSWFAKLIHTSVWIFEQQIKRNKNREREQQSQTKIKARKTKNHKERKGIRNKPRRKRKQAKHQRGDIKINNLCISGSPTGGHFIFIGAKIVWCAAISDRW